MKTAISFLRSHQIGGESRIMKKGFTLIELLIVVAIIAILAAIAVPNFLEAQTRAKVSRAKSDLRTIAVGIEAYTVDYNKPPVDWNCANDPIYAGMTANTSGIPHPGYYDTATNTLHAGLSTPVSYITTAWLKDPFVSAVESFATIDYDQQIFSYNFLTPAPPDTLWGRTMNSSYNTRGYNQYYGAWRLFSIGPDRNWYSEPGATSGLAKGSRVYDSTNGTVSNGNIFRSQKEPEVKGRPAGDITLDPLG